MPGVGLLPKEKPRGGPATSPPAQLCVDGCLIVFSSTCRKFEAGRWAVRRGDSCPGRDKLATSSRSLSGCWIRDAVPFVGPDEHALLF